MERQKPEVVIEYAEPISPGSSQSDEEPETPRRPQRLNAFQTGQRGQIPAGMRPANSTIVPDQEEAPAPRKRHTTPDLRSPLVLVAASIGIGVLIAVYGVKLLKPAVEKVVETATENIVDD